MNHEYIVLPHSIYAKDDSGRILAKIEFPEIRNELPIRQKTGEYDITNTYVAQEDKHQEIGEELVLLALEQIHKAGGKVVKADCPFARKYLHEHHIADL